MKKILCLYLFCCKFILPAQIYTAEKIWSTEETLKTPESVLYYSQGKFLFVSNIDGKPDEKDGKGSIGKVSLTGQVLNVDWVTGLNAPKGMGLYGKKLYVADLTEVVVIDIDKAEIIKRIPVDSSIFLNDITIDKNGVVYVSDTRNFKIHRIEHDSVSTFLTDLKGPNGLLAIEDKLYFLDRGTLYKTDASKNLVVISDGMDKSTDGIEMIKKGTFLVSAWAGVLYYVTPDGDKKILFDKRPFKVNCADIGYDAKKKIIYVPTFYGNKVVAYKLKHEPKDEE